MFITADYNNKFGAAYNVPGDTYGALQITLTAKWVQILNMIQVIFDLTKFMVIIRRWLRNIKIMINYDDIL